MPVDRRQRQAVDGGIREIQMTSYRPGLAAIAWLLLLAACDSGETPESGEQNTEDSTPAIPVEAETPDRGVVYAMYSGTAPIEAIAEASVVAKVAGEIQEIFVEEGDEVRSGDVLASLDGDRLALELNESGARLEKLKKDYARNVELKNRGLISEGDFDTLKYEMDALEAAHKLARLELEYTRIKAPIDGVISNRSARLGNTVTVGDPLFTVTSFDPLVAYLYVPEREYRRIAPGQSAGLQIDALGDTPIIASVTRVSPVVDPETGTFKIAIEIRGDGQRIKPGMFARIGVIYAQRNHAMRVPRAALIEDDNQTSVFVVEDGIAVRRTVDTGFSSDGRVEILSGISDDDLVVTVGQIGLKAGAKVSVIDGESESQKEGSHAQTD